MNILNIYTTCFHAATFIRSKVNSRKVVEAVAVRGEVLNERSTNINVTYTRECLEAYGFGWYPKISESLFWESPKLCRLLTFFVQGSSSSWDVFQKLVTFREQICLHFPKLAIAKLQEVLSKVPSLKQAINRGLATVYHNVYDQQILEDQYPVLQDPMFVRAGQLASLSLLTALPLSNKAEFVTKMYAGIERKFNQLLCKRVQKSTNKNSHSFLVRLITVRLNPSLAHSFNKSTVIIQLRCQS